MKQLENNTSIQEKAVSKPSVPGLPETSDRERTTDYVELKGDIFEKVRQLIEETGEVEFEDGSIEIIAEESEVQVKLDDTVYSINIDLSIGPGYIGEVASSREVTNMNTLELIDNKLSEAVSSLSE